MGGNLFMEWQVGADKVAGKRVQTPRDTLKYQDQRQKQNISN